MRTETVPSAQIFKLIGRNPEVGEDAPLESMEFDSIEKLISYARRVQTVERVLSQSLLRSRIRLGVMLLQVRPQIRHGQWIKWLANAKIHRRSAHRWANMAFELADSNGELDTVKVRDLMIEFEKRENVGEGSEADSALHIEEDPPVSMYKVERALGMRKPHNPCCALEPLMEEDREAIAHLKYMPLALDAPRPAVVIDGEVVQPQMTMQEIQERALQTAAAPAVPNVTNGHKSKRLLGAVAKAVEVMHRMISNFENSLWAANDAVAEQIYTDLRALEDRFQRLVTS